MVAIYRNLGSTSAGHKLGGMRDTEKTELPGGRQGSQRRSQSDCTEFCLGVWFEMGLEFRSCTAQGINNSQNYVVHISHRPQNDTGKYVYMPISTRYTYIYTHTRRTC